MKPLFHPRLVNGPFGDPALFVDLLFDRRALLFDLGDLSALPARKLLRVTHAFVSHAHMDHFVGFDRILRLALGRDALVQLVGPPGFLDRMEHKLGSYTWNLVRHYPKDCTFRVTEVHEGEMVSTRFRCRDGFARGVPEADARRDGWIAEEDGFRVRAALLDHRIPCLGFRLEERLHVNVWKSRLEELGLATGAWLHEVKAAVLRGEPDEALFSVRWREPDRQGGRRLSLGELRREILEVVPGQTLAYVADAAYHPDNVRRIEDLCRGADLLFIETAFLEEDVDQAREKAHLTARQAGLLARQAGARALIPFHFSPKYTGAGERLEREAMAAFIGAEEE